MGTELDLIRAAEEATHQRKGKRVNTRPAISNIIGTPSSSTVATPNSAPLPDFVEGGFTISFEDSVD